jgi:hypothetical protein
MYEEILAFFFIGVLEALSALFLANKLTAKKGGGPFFCPSSIIGNMR